MLGHTARDTAIGNVSHNYFRRLSPAPTYFLIRTLYRYKEDEAVCGCPVSLSSGY